MELKKLEAEMLEEEKTEKKEKEKKKAKAELYEALQYIKAHAKSPDIEKAREAKEKKANLPALLANYFTTNYSIITTGEPERATHWMYAKGIYTPDGKKKIIEQTQKLLEGMHSKRIISEAMHQIYGKTIIMEDRLPEAPLNLVCVDNGIYNIQTKELMPHNPDIIFIQKIPVKYLPMRDCPRIKKFLHEIVPAEDMPVLQEIAGYLLYRRYFIHKAFLLVGTGANGKSTYINLLKKFVGEGAYSDIPLQMLGANRFALAHLHGKLANFFADLSSKALTDTAFFKMTTGEDSVPAEQKFKEIFSLLNYAKMIFSCNQIPRTNDDSDAFFRRWIILNFPNQFKEKNANKKIIEELTTPDEISGFLNYAIEGLHRLLENEEFSNTANIEQVREAYIRQSDSVGAFVMDCIIIKPAQFEEKKELYTNYCEYCRNLKYPVVAENQFHKQLQQQVRVEDYRPKRDGVRIQCWRGIQYEKNWEQVQNTPDMPDIPDQSKFKVNQKPICVNHVNHVNPYPYITREKTKKVRPNVRNTPDMPDIPDTNVIHHKCHKCGKTPCITFDSKNKPICEACLHEVEEEFLQDE